MEFRIVGLLEVADGPRPIEPRGSNLRTLLAVLLLHANKVVSADALVEALWGDFPPAAQPTPCGTPVVVPPAGPRSSLVN